jgi:glycosyltransferase involved in cell wall biosynthesis
MTTPLDLSVVIPTFNRRALVSRAVRSVLEQTTPAREVIVVDDGSTDGTADALEREFGREVTVVRQPNAGVSAARNAGVSVSCGRFLSFLDSDEVWLPRKAELQAACLERNPTFGMVLCDLYWQDAAGRDLGIFRRRDYLPRDGKILEDVLLQPSLVPSSVMMRRAVWDDVGGFDEALPTAEDIDLHIRIARRWRIGVVEEPLVRLVRGAGLSNDPRSCIDYVTAMERAIAVVRDEVGDRLADRALARCYARNARSLLLDDRWRTAWEMARRGWAVAPDRDERVALLGLAKLLFVRFALQALHPLRRRARPDPSRGGGINADSRPGN